MREIANAKHVSGQIVTPDDRLLNAYSVTQKKLRTVLLVHRRLTSKCAMSMKINVSPSSTRIMSFEAV